MYKLKLINYFDVWGNEKDGWEINNLCTEWENKMIDGELTNEKLFLLLKQMNFINKGVRINQLNFIDNGNGIIEIEQSYNNSPLCRIEYIKVEDE